MIETLLELEKKREAEDSGARSLKQLIEDMENEVLANAGVDVFEEVFKLIFTKLYDEMYCFRGRLRLTTRAAQAMGAGGQGASHVLEQRSAQFERGG